MDLGNGRGSQGHLVERGEDIFEWHAEIGLDHGADGLERLGWNLIPAQFELPDELGREQAFTAGDDLTKLDVRRAEMFDGAA